MAGGETIRRRPEGLEEQATVVDFARINGGIAIPLGDFSLRLGGSVLRFSESTVRDLYFGELTWDYRDIFRFSTAAQIEGGRSDDRLSNASAVVGLSVYF